MTETHRRLLLKLADPLGWLLELIGDLYSAYSFVFKKREDLFPM